MRLFRDGNEGAAVERLEGLVAEDPHSVPLRVTLGDARYELGHYRAALEWYEQVLDDQPEHPGCRLGLARCLASRPLLALRLRSPRRVAEILADDDADPELLVRAATVLLRTACDPLEDPLLSLLLRRAILTDPDVERALTQVRRGLCLAPPREAPELALALAGQCGLNEGAWPAGAKEEGRLAAAPAWVRAMYEPGAADPELLERARGIPALTPVCEGNSEEVRGLYEANPYPRWRRLSRAAPRREEIALIFVAQLLAGHGEGRAWHSCSD